MIPWRPKYEPPLGCRSRGPFPVVGVLAAVGGALRHGRRSSAWKAGLREPMNWLSCAGAEPGGPETERCVWENLGNSPGLRLLSGAGKGSNCVGRIVAGE